MGREVDVIDCFDGEYRFLSNFYPAKVEWEGRIYDNNEAAFQSAKCIDEKDRDKFCKMNPSEAKRTGRHVKLREDWEDVKVGVMLSICFAKFAQNEDLRKKLLETGDAELIEGNTWGDKVWGMVDGEGKNHLGRILMKIRDVFRHLETGFMEAKSNKL